ncbi:MAG: TIGR02679 family protein, partial [Acidimicrobiales bacterium]
AWAEARVALAEAGFAAAPWAEPWLDDLRRNTLSGLAPARMVLLSRRAVVCIARLPVVTGDEMPVGRGDLASRFVGDAHALDDGTRLGTAVLRAIAAMLDRLYEGSPAGRRELWRAAGVLPDEVSATVLTYGLHALRETHLTMRDVRRIAWGRVSARRVFVCENPRVLEAAMDAGSRQAIVCTQGNPNVVVTTLLDRLASAGCELCYHGDFDWPGLTIANHLMARHHCRPWRMGADDYEDALRDAAPLAAELPALAGPPVAASWEPELTAAMARAGRVVHEELVLDVLRADLARPTRDQEGAPPSGKAQQAATA